ncbi:hypothetical protein BIY45_13365 [Stenotrophomonas sp. BIIR7]|nr:hypothetical protein BIY45_13365 [Stenotrophomonas sp. BIIR7]
MLNCLYPRVRAIREQMMKKVWWLLLAALPYPAVASVEDPLARPCYMCTASEMYERAESLGVGQHYIYNGASWTNIQGFDVTEVNGQRVATHFVPEPWIRTQYNQMMRLYDERRDEFVDPWGTVSLQPPGAPHVALEQPQSSTILWGHHVAGVNPRHLEARETARRMITRAIRFDYLNADTEHGRVLRIESPWGGITPLISRLNIITAYLGFIEFYFDHETRRWEYLESGDRYARMQETPEDFLHADGAPREFLYRKEYAALRPFFMDRAKWAGVEVIGELPGYVDMVFSCSRVQGKPQCRIANY